MKIELDSKVDGAWAKVGKDIKDGDRLKILDAGQIIEGKFGEQYVFKVTTPQKTEYNLAFNRTSRNTLGRGFGTETEDWRGKIIKAFVVKQMVGDGLKSVLYLAPDKWIMNEDGEFLNPEEVEVDVAEDANEPSPEDIPF